MNGSVSKVHLTALKISQRMFDVRRFVFSLETLLRHREDLEQKEKDELMKKNHRLQTEVHHRDGLAAKYFETMKEMARSRTGEVDARELDLYSLYAKRLTCEIDRSEKRLEKLREQVQEQKQAVVEASKKRKVLASLKARKEREFFSELEKQEHKDVDDLVVTRFVPKNGSRD